MKQRNLSIQLMEMYPSLANQILIFTNCIAIDGGYNLHVPL